MNHLSIQKCYNEGNSWREVAKILNIDTNKLIKMVKNGLLVSRSRSESIKIASKKHPQKHSQETKDKISRKRKEYLKANPDQIPYKLNHKHKKQSYPEKYFSESFGKNFLEQYKVNLYSLDFACLNKKWDIEIDGCQHELDKRIKKHDEKRNKELSCLGWNIIRIRWSKFQKLLHEEKKLIIDSLLQGIIPIHESIIFIKGNENITIQELKFKNEDKRVCPTCLSLKCKQSKLCKKCDAKIRQRKFKINWPDDETLQKMVLENSLLKLSKVLGVSDRAIKKRCERQKIQLPKYRTWSKIPSNLVGLEGNAPSFSG